MSDTQTLSEIKTELIAVAMSTHAQFPQYHGHWDGWVVAKAGPSGCTNRFGDGAEPGEHLLLDPASIAYSEHVGRVCVTVFLSAAYSGGCDTVVFADEVEVLG